jgi:hypothetical protein
MRKRLLLVPFLLFLLPAPACGGAARLAWNSCAADGGVPYRAFGCATNTGAETIVGSFVLDQDVPQAVFVRASLGMINFEYGVPDWWQVNPGGCRQGGLSAFADPSRIGGSACINAWPSLSANTWSAENMTYYLGIEYPVYHWPGAYEMGSIDVQVGCTPAMALEHGVEYLAFALVLSHQKSTGDGACAGCGKTVLMGLGTIRVEQADGTYEDCYPSGCVDCVDETASVWWQSGVVAARPRTWGAIKSLYR